MHCFQSNSTIVRFRVVSLLLTLNCLLIPVVAGLLIYSLIADDRQLILVAMGLGSAAIVVGVLQWMLATRTRCPLCMTPVLASKSCSKHRHARRFLGSFRLRVALAVLCRESFHCPYCHEQSAMQLRNRQPFRATRHY